MGTELSAAFGTMNPLIVGGVALIIGVGLGFFVARLGRWYRARRVRLALRERISAVSLDHVRDVLVPDGNGGALHIDFALLTPRGLLVLDMRDVAGNVFGSDQMAEWTVMDGAQRSTFPNPQNTLYDRVAAVKALAGELSVEGRIVFMRRSVFPKGLPRFTLSIDSLSQEFPLGDRSLAERNAAPFQAAWEAVKAQLAPSPLAKI